MKYLFLCIFLSLFSLNAHHKPFINYEEIATWCSHLALTHTELKIMSSYLQLVKQLGQECSKDLGWINSASGKDLEAKIDYEVNEIMKYPALAVSFREFTFLIKKELEQNNEVYTLKNKTKNYYTVLALVADGCIMCVQKKLEI